MLLPLIYPSVCLCVTAWAYSSKAAAASFLLRAQPAGDIDRLLHDAQQYDVQRVWHAVGKCRQCHVVSICRKLNTELLFKCW